MKKNNYIVLMVIILLFSFVQIGSLTHGVYSMFEENKENSSQTVNTEVSEFKEGVPEKITIGKINLELPIVLVPLQNGTWYVNSEVANFAEGTSLVKEDGGNVGIFAHDREIGFGNIKNLSEGDEIILTGKGFSAKYKVTTTSVTAPTEVSVFQQTDSSTLTLVTCEGFFSEKRFIVKADLVSLEKN